MTFAELVTGAGTVMEAAGVATMIGGACIAIAVAAGALVRRVAREAVFRSLRQNLGRAILLGLEFLVAADIIRTVSTVPTLRQVAALGGIVLIRTFLSFTLEVELEGRWPWRGGPRGRRGRDGASAATSLEDPRRAPPPEPTHAH